MSAAARAYAALALVLLLIAVAAGGLKTGIDLERKRSQAEIATLKQGWAESSARAEAAARQRLETAQALGDVLTRDLLKTESSLNQKSQEIAREINRHTTGRVCLSADAVRLLNSPNHPDTRNELPTPASSVAATDGPAATDRDIAVWIDNARRKYDICRARLDALIEWTAPTLDATAPALPPEGAAVGWGRPGANLGESPSPFRGEGLGVRANP